MLQFLTTQVTDAARNAWALAFGDGVEPPHATPSTVIHDEPHQLLRRFTGPASSPAPSPVLLVPPLAAPASCFDLRKGQSLAEFLVGTGRRTYLVDYGEIGFADRHMGMADWLDEIIPNAIRRTSAAEGGAAVDVVAWSIGGTLSLLTAAAHHDLPIRSITAVGSPIDYSKLPMLQPWRRIGKLTGGEPVTSVYRLAGGIPGALVRTGFTVTALDRLLTKPAFIARNLLNTEALGKMQAVDRFMSAMPAYPGRFYGQVNGRLIIHNDLARGTLKLGARRIDLSKVTVPVHWSPGQPTSSPPRRPPARARGCSPAHRSGSRPPRAATSASSPDRRPARRRCATSTSSSPLRMRPHHEHRALGVMQQPLARRAE